jgi:hypothetical protein
MEINMEETSKTYVFNSDVPYGNRGGFDTGALMGMLAGNGANGFGLGGNTIGELIALAIVASIFGWNGGGFGFGGNNAGNAGFLSNQISDNSTRDLVLQAINGTDADVRALATNLNVDVESLKTGINTVNSAVAALSAQTGMSGLQIINSIQSGNSALAAQLSQCCCENRLLTTQQGYESRIATIEQTNQLGSQADRNSNAILSAINAQTVAMNDGFCAIKERELQGKIDSLLTENGTLKTALGEARQTAQFSAMLSPIATKLVEIENKQPNTVPVQWPNLTAVNTTPYMSYGFNGYGYGNAWGGSYWG